MDVKTMNSATLPTFFSDISPIYDHSEDKNKTCCRIVYTDEAEISFGYFYAILQAKEYSDRSLQLTALCLKLNPANYTVWHFRRRCLFALCERSKGGVEDSVKTIQKELDDVSNMAGSNPKNYQIWYHRRALLEYVANKFQALDRFHEEELDYIDSVFEVDVKNYHAWSHRKWFISTIAGLVYNAKDKERKESFENMNQLRLWNEELEFSDNLIKCDIRNNSAWNYRYFLVSRGEADFEFSEDVLKFEAAYSIEKISLDPFNESPWHYLLGFVAYAKEDDDFVTFIEQEIYKIEANLGEIGVKKGMKCSQLLAALVEIFVIKNDRDSLHKATTYCMDLALNCDPTRAKYWLFREKQISCKLKDLT